MSRKIFWFILNAGSWLFGVGGFLYTLVQFESAETVLQQTAAGAYGAAIMLFAIFLHLQGKYFSEQDKNLNLDSDLNLDTDSLISDLNSTISDNAEELASIQEELAAAKEILEDLNDEWLEEAKEQDEEAHIEKTER